MRRKLSQILAIVVLVYLITTIITVSKLQVVLRYQDWNFLLHDSMHDQENRVSCYKGPVQMFVTSTRNRSRGITAELDKCMSNQLSTDIQMETEWTQIDASYPKYILSASGWLEVVKVLSWKPKQLKVIIVPHSHNDPGWLQTYDESYMRNSKRILNLMVEYLAKNPNWKFIWSEVCFLMKWWSEVPVTRKLEMKRLLQTGQLEIVTGGYVMSDEATTHYATMLDQLIEGHQWLSTNLGIMPNTSWSVDPFGHSPSMTYLLGRSGVHHGVIQRVHYAVKRHLAQSNSLEFNWRQTWATDKSTDMLFHIMPFLSYSIPHSCGPDAHICCQFDFGKKKCPLGNNLTIDDSNLNQKAWELWEQYQKKAEVFRSGVILVPHGDDFRYKSPMEWTSQFQNMEKLMDYINRVPQMNMEVKFGTVRDYFEELGQYTDVTFPSLSGDFFPYNDRRDEYWTGYYTSRPHYKYMSRKLQNLLRSVEILYTMMQASKNKSNSIAVTESLMNYQSDLTEARQELALFHHHDAITGTAKHHVMANYAKRLRKAYQKMKTLYQFLISVIIEVISLQTEEYKDGDDITLLENWVHYNGTPFQETVFITKPRTILVHNTLSHNRQDVIHIHIDRSEVKVIDGVTDQVIPHQISPIWNGTIFRTDFVELSFEVSQPALSVKKYLILPDDASPPENRAVVQEITDSPGVRTALRTMQFKVHKVNVIRFNVSNLYMTAVFYTCNGRLQYIIRHEDGDIVKTQVQLLKYGTGSSYNPFKDRSGAYIFLPDGQAEDLQEHISGIYVITGPVYSMVITIQQTMVQSVTLYNLTGPLGSGVHIDNKVNLQLNNSELIMRVDSSVVDVHNKICTDLNGFQMHRKKMQKKLGIQGNFHPMTTMSLIENDQDRLTLINLGSRGVASLRSGWLEVVLDRRLIQDDWRGLGQGVTDNIPTISNFVLLIEKRERNFEMLTGDACYPSQLASRLSDQLQYPAHVSAISHLHSHDQTKMKLNSQTELLNTALPQDITLLNLRSLPTSQISVEALMLIHRQHVDCGFLYKFAEYSNEMRVIPSNLFKYIQILDLQETSLTGTRVIQTLNPKDEVVVPPMEIKTYKLSLDWKAPAS